MIHSTKFRGFPFNEKMAPSSVAISHLLKAMLRYG